MKRISRLASLLVATALEFGVVPVGGQALPVGGRSPLMAASAAAPRTSADPHGPRDLTLKEGTPVVLAFAENVSSRTAQEGAPVTLVVAQDLRVEDATVVKAGTRVVGRVTYVRRAATAGRSGALAIQPGDLQIGDRHVALRGATGQAGDGSIEYHRPYRLKWPFGFFRTGDEVEIQQGTVLAAFVARDTLVSAAK